MMDPYEGRPHAHRANNDPILYAQALAIVMADGCGSCSRIQRELAIGWGLAEAVLDRMTEEGILGPRVGHKFRTLQPAVAKPEGVCPYCVFGYVDAKASGFEDGYARMEPCLICGKGTFTSKILVSKPGLDVFETAIVPDPPEVQWEKEVTIKMAEFGPHRHSSAHRWWSTWSSNLGDHVNVGMIATTVWDSGPIMIPGMPNQTPAELFTFRGVWDNEKKIVLPPPPDHPDVGRPDDVIRMVGLDPGEAGGDKTVEVRFPCECPPPAERMYGGWHLVEGRIICNACGGQRKLRVQQVFNELCRQDLDFLADLVKSVGRMEPRESRHRWWEAYLLPAYGDTPAGASLLPLFSAPEEDWDRGNAGRRYRLNAHYRSEFAGIWDNENNVLLPRAPGA
jgi:hypothetical protein